MSDNLWIRFYINKKKANFKAITRKACEFTEVMHVNFLYSVPVTAVGQPQF